MTWRCTHIRPRGKRPPGHCFLSRCGVPVTSVKRKGEGEEKDETAAASRFGSISHSTARKPPFGQRFAVSPWEKWGESRRDQSKIPDERLPVVSKEAEHPMSAGPVCGSVQGVLDPVRRPAYDTASASQWEENAPALRVVSRRASHRVVCCACTGRLPGVDASRLPLGGALLLCRLSARDVRQARTLHAGARRLP
jgi:hypothetical protein